MNRLVLTVTLAMLAGAIAGCGPEPAVEVKASAALPAQPTIDQITANPGQYAFFVRMEMCAIEVPVGGASGSERIWSYLDEEAVKVFGTATLPLNGMRAGKGREGTWPDMAGILTRLTGQKLSEGHSLMIPGQPMPITLRKHDQTETIFTFYMDRLLTGADYPPGDYLLMVSCTIDRDDPTRLVLTAVPRIRSTSSRTRFVIADGRPRMENKPDTFDLSELTFQAQMNSRDYLIVGPGQAVRKPTSAGRHFLVFDKEGMEFERVLVFRPEVIAMKAAPAEPVVPDKVARASREVRQ